MKFVNMIEGALNFVGGLIMFVFVIGLSLSVPIFVIYAGITLAK